MHEVTLKPVMTRIVAALAALLTSSLLWAGTYVGPNTPIDEGLMQAARGSKDPGPAVLARINENCYARFALLAAHVEAKLAGRRHPVPLGEVHNVSGLFGALEALARLEPGRILEPAALKAAHRTVGDALFWVSIMLEAEAGSRLWSTLEQVVDARTIPPTGLPLMVYRGLKQREPRDWTERVTLLARCFDKPFVDGIYCTREVSLIRLVDLGEPAIQHLLQRIDALVKAGERDQARKFLAPTATLLYLLRDPRHGMVNGMLALEDDPTRKDAYRYQAAVIADAPNPGVSREKLRLDAFFKWADAEDVCTIYTPGLE